MTNLPFVDCHFDAIISVSVIHHAVKRHIMATVNDVHRILNKKGLFVANLASVNDPRYKTGQEIENNTFLISEAFEKNQFEELHHFFTKSEVLKLLARFSKKNVKLVDKKPHYWEVTAAK